MVQDFDLKAAQIGSRRYIQAFAVVFALFVVYQIAVFFGTIAVFPDGYATEDYYSPIALNLKNYGVLSGGVFPDLPPETERMPLFPTVLAGLYWVFGEHEVVGVVFNNVFVAVAIFVVHLAARQVNPAVALFAPALLMLDTVYLMEANRNQTDAMFFLLMALFLLLAIRLVLSRPTIQLIATASAVLLLAAFTRPVPIYLWAPMGVAFLIVFWRTSTPKRAVTLVVVFLMIQGAGMGAWIARNNAVAGIPSFATMQASHLTYFFAPYVVAVSEGSSSEAAFEELKEEIRRHVEAENLTGSEENAYASEVGRAIVREHPIASIVVVLRNQPRLFLGYPFEPITALLGPDKLRAYLLFNETYAPSRFLFDSGLKRRLELVKFHHESGLIVPLVYGFLNKAMNALVVLLGGIGIVIMLFSRRNGLWPLAVLSIAYLAYMVPISSLVTAGRFRLPIMPLLAIGAIFCLWYFFGIWRNRRRSLARSGKTAS